MRGFGRKAAALGFCVLLAAPARAGLYNTEETLPLPTAVSFERFQSVLTVYLSATLPDSPLRQHYLQRIADLEAKGESGLSVDERVNLAAYYIRLGNVSATPEEGSRLFEKAIALLEPLATDRQKPNFMALANLGMAHHLMGRLDRAAAYVEQALAAWPSDPVPGWSRAQLSWYRKAEKYYLTLLKSRFEESRLASRGPETLDALFPRVRFIGPHGQYAAGDMDPVQASELPQDAVEIVGQLLLWMPGDPRLYWLLGELLNGQRRDVLTASAILDSLVWERKYSFKEIQEHRQVLNAGRTSARAVVLLLLDPLACEQLSGTLLPHGAGLAPGVAGMTSELGWMSRAYLAARAQKAAETQDQSPATIEKPALPSASWLPDVKHVLVSFLAGVVVTLLGTLQYRELRRRSGERAAERAPEARG